jgi:hypothetical protein
LLQLCKCDGLVPIFRKVLDAAEEHPSLDDLLVGGPRSCFMDR